MTVDDFNKDVWYRYGEVHGARFSVRDLPKYTLPIKCQKNVFSSKDENFEVSDSLLEFFSSIREGGYI